MSGIKDLIRAMVADIATSSLVLAKITAVNKQTDTCTATPIDGAAPLIDVKLEAVDNDGSVKSDIVLYPVVGCFAFIGLISHSDHDEAVLIKATQYESVVMNLAGGVVLNISQGAIDLKADSITLNGGKNKGLVNVEPLVKKINKVEETLNDLIKAFTTHAHPGVSLGGSTTAVTVTKAPDAIVQKTKLSDLEDTNILH